MTGEPQLTDHHSLAEQQAQVPERQARARMVAAALIGGIVAVFALLNLDDVKVHWLIATGRTPLIVVIVLAFALGAALDRLVVIRARRRRTES